MTDRDPRGNSHSTNHELDLTYAHLRATDRILQNIVSLTPRVPVATGLTVFPECDSSRAFGPPRNSCTGLTVTRLIEPSAGLNRNAARGRRTASYHFTLTMTIFRAAVASLLLASSHAGTPDNVSSRLMVHVRTWKRLLACIAVFVMDLLFQDPLVVFAHRTTPNLRRPGTYFYVSRNGLLGERRS